MLYLQKLTHLHRNYQLSLTSVYQMYDFGSQILSTLSVWTRHKLIFMYIHIYSFRLVSKIQFFTETLIVQVLPLEVCEYFCSLCSLHTLYSKIFIIISHFKQFFHKHLHTRNDYVCKQNGSFFYKENACH